jgi:hypothetical protein
MIRDRFNMILSAAALNSLYISFPKPASAVLPRTNPWLQNCSGGKSLTLEAPETKKSLSSCLDSISYFLHKHTIPKNYKTACFYSLKRD